METKNDFKEEYFETVTSKGLLERIGFRYIIKEVMPKLPKNAKVLDVGCGLGIYLNEIHKLRPDLELYGSDVANIGDKLKPFINFTQESGDNMHYKDNMFDLIINFHVLEHVLNPHDFIVEFKRVLKRGGLMYVEMPNYMLAMIPGSANFYNDPTHLRPHCVSSIRKLFVENNLEPIKVKVWYNWLTIFGFPYFFLRQLFMIDDSLSIWLASVMGKTVGGLAKK